jgi:hypothetical protein
MRIILFFVLFWSFYAHAQSQLIAPYIKAWQTSDTSQTHKAEKTYSLLKVKKDVLEYRQIVNEMYAYLKDHPNDRLWIRTVMYDVFGKIELGIWTEAEFSRFRPILLECIKLASQLNDDQLKAELYAQYAELNRKNSNYVLYNLKAIELQRKVGNNHFEYVTNRYYNVSLGLYANEDYKQSINYGLKCLSLNSEKSNSFNPHLQILQTDIVGASYYKLAKLDSSKYFYQQILNTLINKPDPDPDYQDLWVAIAKGNIGRVLALQNQADKAIPLLNEYLSTSMRLKSLNNVAMGKNTLGTIYLKNKAYSLALNNFRMAYHYATIEGMLSEKVLASKGLADGFRASNQTDSAFAYYALYQQHRDKLIERVNEGKLSAMNARIAFDNMQASLNEAETIISNQRLIRNLILVTIVLLTVIALLFYNRKMLRQKHVAETLKRERKLAEQKADQARTQIVTFKENIIEKENLIFKLQKQLALGNVQLNESLLQYTLVTDTEWEKFRLEFSKAYPDFLPSLQQILPAINPAEERLATLLYLKLTSNQIANTLGIGKESVGRSKRRLKQRLNLETGAKLEDFIYGLT